MLLRRAWLEVYRGRQGRLVLSPRSARPQHRHSPKRVAGSRVDPKTGNAEIVALGVRNSVGDVDPRSGRYCSRKRATTFERQAQHDLEDRRAFRLSLLPPGISGSRSRWATLEFTAVLNLGAHVAPLACPDRRSFPADKNNIFIAEHGPEPAQYQGARIKRVIVGPDSKNAKQEIFASADRATAAISAVRPAGQGSRCRRRRLGRCDLPHQRSKNG